MVPGRTQPRVAKPGLKLSNRRESARLGAGRVARTLGALPTKPSSFTLRQTSPDTEFFSVLKGVFEAIVFDFAASTDLFCLAGRGPSLGEEEVGVNTEAICLLLPRPVRAHRYVQAVFQF